MKKNLSFCLFLLGAWSLEAHSHRTYIVEEPTYVIAVAPERQAYVLEVESAPPADFDEDVGVSPGDGYVWIKGHWQWDGMHWVRAHGHWDLRPHAAAVWAPGYWKEHHNHWSWHEGCWR